MAEKILQLYSFTMKHAYEASDNNDHCAAAAFFLVASEMETKWPALPAKLLKRETEVSCGSAH